MHMHNRLTRPSNHAPVREPAMSGTREDTDIGLLHVNAGLLVERYVKDCDPCVAIWVSRQFRLIAENAALSDTELRVLYRSLAARWHQMAIVKLTEVRPGKPWLDEFADGARA